MHRSIEPIIGKNYTYIRITFQNFRNQISIQSPMVYCELIYMILLYYDHNQLKGRI